MMSKENMLRKGLNVYILVKKRRNFRSENLRDAVKKKTKNFYMKINEMIAKFFFFFLFNKTTKTQINRRNRIFLQYFFSQKKMGLFGIERIIIIKSIRKNNVII